MIATMGTPVFLKFARLVSAVLFIRISADFIYASLSTTKYGVAPDFADVEAARTRSVYFSSGLQLFDNVLVVAPVFRAAPLTDWQLFSRHILDIYQQDTGAQCCYKYVHVSTTFTVMLMRQWCLASHVISEEPV